MARAGRARRAAAARRLGRARRHDRAWRGARRALWGTSGSTSRRLVATTSRTRSTTSIRMRSTACAACATLGLRVGIVGNQTEALEALGARLGASRPTSSRRRRASASASRTPRSSTQVVELMGCAPGEVAYVGDRVDNDVLPAAAAGLVAVHVRRGPWGRLQATPPEAALGLDDLASLPEALASLAMTRAPGRDRRRRARARGGRAARPRRRVRSTIRAVSPATRTATSSRTR